MVNMNKILNQVLSSNAAGGFTGGLAGGLASSMLTSKSGRKMGKKALKMGGIAAVGALAYTAYQRYQENQSGAQVNQNSAAAAAPATSTIELTPAPQGSAFLPAVSDQTANDALGLTLVRAMISVARADGRLDAEESTAIFQKIETLDLDDDSQKLLVKEMSQPVDMDAIVNAASSPEVAAEIYTASLLAVAVDSAAEKAYLAMLAARLELPDELVSELERAVDAQKSVAA